MPKQQKLVILSGLSGSGKTIALHTLEDAGYYCVDNLPAGLLQAYVDNMQKRKPALFDLIAVSIDARSGVNDMIEFESVIHKIKDSGINTEVIFLTTETKVLLSRFSETRRKHPLSRKGLPLIEAIHLEKNILKNIFHQADLLLDTSELNVHDLRKQIASRVTPENSQKLALLFQSFGFKHGTPTDTDFIFDVRCLPNPHWDINLREFTGQQEPVIDFLSKQPEVNEMFVSIKDFIRQWIPKFEAENRSYVTVSIGCTGGHHRSVYLAERLGSYFQQQRENVTIRHREL
ncbi:MAG: RNase adapter RapZ [Gammaproteobacteria bacterium]|nr:RNase adapter RapZ [Gammaproteobacteria bacterium]